MNLLKEQRYVMPLFIFTLLFLSIFFGFYGAGKSLWLDEAYSVLVAKQNFSQLLVSLENDAHPPLYYLLLSFWIKIFGDGEIAVHGLSGVFYLGGVLTVYRLGNEIYEKRIGLLAAFFYALSPLATGTANSARMYALLGFIAALSTLLIAKLFLQNNKTFFVFSLYVFVNVLGTFTQIWFFFLLAAQVLTYLILFYPKNLRQFFALQFFSVLPFIILWTPILLTQLKITATAWMGRPGLSEIGTVLLGFYGEKIALIFYFSVIILLLLSCKIWSKDKRNIFFQTLKEYFKTKSTAFFILIFSLSIIIPFLIGQFKPIFGQTRYTIIALPVFVLVLASLLYKFINRTVLIIFCGLLLCLNGYAFVRYYNRPEICSDRKLTAELVEKVENGDVLIFTSLSRTTTDYYLQKYNSDGNFVEFTFPHELDTHPGWRNNRKMLENKENLQNEAETLLNELQNRKTKRIWIFYGLDNEVSDILKTRLDKEFLQTDKIGEKCTENSGNQSDAFYTQILLYQTN